MCTHVTLNKVDTIVQCAGTLWFPGNRSAVFDCGCTSPHRSQYEIVCEKGTLKVDDLVGGQQRTGNFAAYEVPFVGSAEYIQGDVMGKDQVVQVEACDHVHLLHSVCSGPGSCRSVQPMCWQSSTEHPKTLVQSHLVTSPSIPIEISSPR